MSWQLPLHGTHMFMRISALAVLHPCGLMALRIWWFTSCRADKDVKALDKKIKDLGDAYAALAQDKALVEKAKVCHELLAML
jgi:hypothetical protein